MAGIVLAPLVSLAGQVYHVYEDNIQRDLIESFDEGDVVIYHTKDGRLKRFILGKYFDVESAHGRVFELAGPGPKLVVKFSKDKHPRDAQVEINSFRAIKRQGLPHAKLRDYDVNFYIVKDKVEGKTLLELEKEFVHHSRSERTEILKTLAPALQSFEEALRRGPYGFDDLHLNNLIFDGKSLQIIDVADKHKTPEKSVLSFRGYLKDLTNIRPGLDLAVHHPEWLERLYDLQESRGHAFLTSENASANEIKEAIRLGRPVPVAIQEQVVEAAKREIHLPRFKEKVEPVLTNILQRKEISEAAQKTILIARLNRAENIIELVEVSKQYSKLYKGKPLPGYLKTFFRKFMITASWENVQRVFQLIPPEFKPLLIASAAQTARDPKELMRAFSLPLVSTKTADADQLKLAVMNENYSEFARIGQRRRSKFFLDLRNRIQPGTSAKARSAYAELYVAFTRDAVLKSKTKEDAIHAFDDLPHRLTPETREKLAALRLELREHFNELKMSSGDKRKITHKIGVPKKAVACILQLLADSN